ncbi:Lmo0850 family protein [Anoxybacillus sp. J5B_2022]|uniref:Lmo0850 family protein n=1 Tax=Anoxybacillus sp. J5B_2022 TaxID=3003246 RepID=UPI002285F553|nr:Lmo0850 family protein [Anoxybacillus sp. J5B_2022]MCZ0756714.1 Lmo0850 family protein [Anoxybacillus sp. J5B_2022]
MNKEKRVLQIVKRLRAMGIPAEITKSKLAILAAMLENSGEKIRKETLANGNH